MTLTKYAPQVNVSAKIIWDSVAFEDQIMTLTKYAPQVNVSAKIIWDSVAFEDQIVTNVSAKI